MPDASQVPPKATQSQQPNLPPQRGSRPDPFALLEAQLPAEAVNLVRVVRAIIGVVAVLAGLALLIIPDKTLQVLAIALGVYLIVSGVVRAVAATVARGLPGGWRVLDLLVGVLLVIGGIVIIKNVTASAAALALTATLIIGIGWLLEGVMTLSEAWHVPNSGFAVFAGFLSVIAGIIVLFMPVQMTVVLVIYVGVALIVLGVISFVRAFRFGRAPRSDAQ